MTEAVGASPEPAARIRFDRVRISWFRVLLGVQIGLVLLVAGALLWWGHDYYLSPIGSRPAHPHHSVLRPSGTIGRPLGIAGAVMMLLTFLYPIRKRSVFLQKFGAPSQWLQFHILLGLGGPCLVVFHTGGKLSGIAAIAFYSMMAMVVSGVVGRYLYSRIPRTRKGREMSLRQIEEQLDVWIEQIGRGAGREQILGALEEYLGHIRQVRGNLFTLLLRSVADDVAFPSNACRAWRIARMLPDSLAGSLATTRLILKQRRLLKNLALLEASQRMFAYWHIFHRPFTVLASVVIAIHIAVVSFFGYGVRW